MSKEAMKQALDVLEYHVEHFDSEQYTSICELEPAKDAITSLRQAIAEAEKQEPVAIVGMANTVWFKEIPIGTKLYTHPQPKPSPLTDEQINKRAKEEGAHNADFWAGVRFAEDFHCVKEQTK